VAVAFALVAAPAALAADPLTVEQAIAVRTPSDLQLTADGRRLAFTVALPPKGAVRQQEIWVLDLESHKPRRFAHSPKSERAPRWSPDGRRLAFLSDREERSQVYVMPADGGEAERLTEGKNAVSAFEWSPDGKHIAFLAPEPKSEAEEKREKDKDDARIVDDADKRTRLWVIEVETRKVRRLTAGAWQVVQVCWAPRGDRLFVLATDRPNATVWDNRLFAVALADGSMKEVAAPAGPVSNLQAAPDGSNLSYIGAREGGPSPHDLFVLPVSGGSPRNLTAGFDRPIEGYTWVREGLLAVAADGFRSRCLVVTTDGKTHPVEGTKTNPAGRAVRTESGVMAFVGQTATELPEVWLHSPGGSAEPVTKFNDDFHSRALVKPEFYRYRGAGGVEIEAALYRPTGGAKVNKAPLVVLVHGGPTGRWADAYFSWAQLLAGQGHAVFCPNVRGSTGYGWKFLTLNRADWGGGDFQDILAGMDNLVRRGVADPARLGIGGWSYGGYMAAWAITQTDRFKAAVVGAGMSDLASEFGTEDGPQYDQWFYGVPYERPDGFSKSSPITHIKKARTPTLILHGEDDRVDPLGQAQQLYRGLRHYGVACEFVVYPREGHGIREQKHMLDLHRRLLRWFDDHLK
jgi:dipeptidyl aminopeptidase/acylaminoacyl peptidase